jgi:hypothetical protein
MQKQERINYAHALLANPVFVEFFNGAEAAAVNAAMYAAPTDHELRLAKLTEAKAIRALREQLTLLTSEEVKSPPKGGFA